METFETDTGQYRVVRSEHSGAWMLFENTGTRLGWHFVTEFDAAIYEEDIIDRAKVYLRGDQS